MEEDETQAPPYAGASEIASVGSSGGLELIHFYWSVARVDLGLSDEEFLAQTPYSLDLLIQRLESADLKRFFPTADLCALVATFLRDAKKHPEPFTALDFVPERLWPEGASASKASKEEKPRYNFRELSPRNQRRMLEAFFVTPKGKQNDAGRKGKAGGQRVKSLGKGPRK